MRLLAALMAFVFVTAAQSYETGRAPFSVVVGELEIPFSVFAIYVLPGEEVQLRVQSSDSAAEFSLSAASGKVTGVDARQWQWEAPREPGLVRISIAGQGDGTTLNALIMHPASAVRDERLGDYRIGTYESEPLNGNPIYNPPPGFIELSADLADLQVSPHFRLGQFPSKQSTDFPKFLVLREELLLKLEFLLERLNERGIEADSLVVMSGFRTPYYNAAIGNVPYSRHVYGGAADVFVDVNPVDDYMDDLNGDGTRDYRDSQWLFGLADELFGAELGSDFHGGLGVYRRTSAHGPFLHVDARGQRARWGLLP